MGLYVKHSFCVCMDMLPCSVYTGTSKRSLAFAFLPSSPDLWGGGRRLPGPPSPGVQRRAMDVPERRLPSRRAIGAVRVRFRLLLSQAHTPGPPLSAVSRFRSARPVSLITTTPRNSHIRLLHRASVP